MGLFDKVANTATLGIWDKIMNPGSTTQAQVPLETPEQKKAREMLAKFMESGTFGGFTAGGDAGISTSLTPTEQTGQTQLDKLLASGIPSQYAMGDTALKGLLTVDPAEIQAQFDPFKAQVNRQIAESNQALKRSAGFAGNLYSTNTVENLGNIATRGNETLTAQLANLTNAALDRRLQAIPLAFQSGAAQEGIALDRISSAYTYGGKSRDLANTEALRKRTEMTLPMQVAQGLAGNNANFGVPEITTQNPNPMMDLITAIISGGSKIIASKKGG